MRNSGEQQMFQQISSPSVGLNSVNINVSNIFGGRKSSFDFVNYQPNQVKSSYESERPPPYEYRNSLDILESNIQKPQKNTAPLKNIIQIYNEKNKIGIEAQGFQPIQICEVQSESQIINQYDEAEAENQRIDNNNFDKSKGKQTFSEINFNYYSYFPHDLADVLKERQIPLEYVKGLLLVRDQKEIKSTRRLKVERYLQKRRKKTWNRKICYDCRQKVAEERLRIKGKFIKKRRAMQILGLTIPIQTSLLKEKLCQALKNKSNSEVMEIINRGHRLYEDESSSSNEEMDEIEQKQEEQMDEQ